MSAAGRLTVAVLVSLVATGIAGVFAAQLARQYRARGRPHALAWAISLALFAVATAAVAVGMVTGWPVGVFALYWLAGALLTVPFLAVGQLLLLDPRRSVLYATIAGLMTVWALAALLLSPMDPVALQEAAAAGGIPVGAEVFGEEALAFRLLGYYNYTALVVVGGVVWSAATTRRWIILLIAVGVVVAGASFAFVRAGLPAAFSASLAAGVALMYAGFKAAGKPPKPRRKAVTSGEAA